MTAAIKMANFNIQQKQHRKGNTWRSSNCRIVDDCVNGTE